jgi:hypothetical protein
MLPKINLSLYDAQTIAAPWYLITKLGQSLAHARTTLNLCFVNAHKK